MGLALSMMTAELIAPHQFRLVEQEIAPPARGEIQVRVDAVGVCGSDLHVYSEGAVGDTPSVFPMVLGHEPAGTVVRVGAGVTGWSVGDRAALEPALYCYHCEYCRAGRHNICANIRFLSNPGLPGFFREFVNLPPVNLLAIPPGLSMELAALVEPLAVALHSLKLAAPRAGETVAVFGAGAIGLLTIASLKVAGVPSRTGAAPGRGRGGRPRGGGRSEADRRRHGRARRGLRFRLRGRGADRQPGHPRGVPCGARGVDGDSLRSAGAVRHFEHAAQGSDAFQCAAVERRIAGGAGNAGGAHRVVRSAGDASAESGECRGGV